jgi:hypothetical protein
MHKTYQCDQCYFDKSSSTTITTITSGEKDENQDPKLDFDKVVDPHTPKEIEFHTPEKEEKEKSTEKNNALEPKRKSKITQPV